MEIAELEGFMDRLVTEGIDEVENPLVMARLEGVHCRFEALMARSADRFEVAGRWGADGAKNAVMWLATRTHLPKGTIGRQVRLGRLVHQMAHVEAAWSAGTISGAHVEAMGGVLRPLTKEAFARDEALLVEKAATLRFDHFASVMAYWQSRANPDGSEQAAQDRRDRRDVFVTESFEGMYLGRVTLDPISGAIVTTELARIEAELFGADCTEAQERLGRRPHLDELARTPNQRRADALVEMAVRSKMAPPGGPRPAPLFTVLVGYDQLAGPVLELAQGLALTPGALVPWLEAADVERAVFAPKGRLEISEHSRFFTGATRRALEIRDRECTHHYCDIKAQDCQGDHIERWADGGLTHQANGQLACGFHNRLRNERPPPDDEPF